VTVKLLEHHGKHLLVRAGLRVPRGAVASSPEEARTAASRIGSRVVLKAQVPTGRRGKSGAVLFADSPDEAASVAEGLLGLVVDGYPVHELLVEECVDIDQELYAAVLNDPVSKGPLILFSTSGGMDIEEVNSATPELVRRLPVDITHGLDIDDALSVVSGSELVEAARPAVADALVRLYAAYRSSDADLAEVNPLVLTRDGQVIALDAKVSIDPGSLPRQEEIVSSAPTSQEQLTTLERRGRELGLQFIELDGDIGVLANGAGLTMTTLDVVSHYGGRPANFLEIGGDAYIKATSALALVLDNPRVRSLLVNFCGAFARTDVMAEGVVAALEELRPDVPVFFTIHGTGEEDAVRLVGERLGVEPYDLMDDAVRAAVEAAAAVGPDIHVEVQ
jgi:succinyl-CoA synthetase beta subunit